MAYCKDLSVGTVTESGGQKTTRKTTCFEGIKYGVLGRWHLVTMREALSVRSSWGRRLAECERDYCLVALDLPQPIGSKARFYVDS